MADNPLAEWLQAGQEPRGRADRDDEGPGTRARAEDDPPAPGPERWPDLAQDPPRRRWPLGVLAALPWAVVVVVAVALLRPGSGDAGPSPAQPPTAATAPTAAPTPPAASEAPAPPPPGEDDQALSAAAAVFVRTELTNTDPGAAGARAGRPRYVDLAVPESVSRAAGAAVVTVRALVLEGRAGRWVDATVARYAVPMGHVGTVPVPLAEPWAVTSTDATRPSRRWQPVPDDPAPARAALRRAGYVHLSGIGLARDPTLPGVLRARVTAVAPGDGEPRVHEVWLSTRPRGVAVLGLD